MKYTIISLNDDRLVYKQAIRERVDGEEIELPAVDGNAIDVQKELDNRGIPLHGNLWGNPRRGEIGVWLSNYDRWEIAAGLNEPLMVFEDDAIVNEQFNERIAEALTQLPDDWDFMSLWVPENQLIDYQYKFVYMREMRHIYGTVPKEHSRFRTEHLKLARAYQGYGMVALMYSPKGGARLAQLAREQGLTGPVDCWIYERSQMGYVQGYAPHPDFADIVTYDWSAVSHIHLTERVE